MRVVRGSRLPAKQEGAAWVRVLMAPEEGMARVSITQVDLASGSATPEHSHDTDQMVYVLEGEALFTAAGEAHRLAAGDLIYVPAGQLHQHHCAGPGTLRQLSLFVPPG